jgi:hypothetical protein
MDRFTIEVLITFNLMIGLIFLTLDYFGSIRLNRITPHQILQIAVVNAACALTIGGVMRHIGIEHNRFQGLFALITAGLSIIILWTIFSIRERIISRKMK